MSLRRADLDIYVMNTDESGKQLLYDSGFHDADIDWQGDRIVFIVNADGCGETRLTDTGYAQGLASWSHAGDRLVYIASAIGDTGQFDMYMIEADGSNNHNITPGYFPSSSLVHEAVFSTDDSRIFFIGEWWE